MWTYQPVQYFSVFFKRIQEKDIFNDNHGNDPEVIEMYDNDYKLSSIPVAIEAAVLSKFLKSPKEYGKNLIRL